MHLNVTYLLISSLGTFHLPHKLWLWWLVRKNTPGPLVRFLTNVTSIYFQLHVALVWGFLSDGNTVFILAPRYLLCFIHKLFFLRMNHKSLMLNLEMNTKFLQHIQAYIAKSNQNLIRTHNMYTLLGIRLIFLGVTHGTTNFYIPPFTTDGGGGDIFVRLYFKLFEAKRTLCQLSEMVKM
ncbi:hypothetical protein FF38_07702 [Lucilia cuprina]|uniref:Uncharacterized protein n=1 Tax=Lucilia cuprina TaxID=7375 RepID=A0A0L0CID2_LUCCU|nr:hypothetical protein FF38_07702 [Lucilia cuprina]